MIRGHKTTTSLCLIALAIFGGGFALKHMLFHSYRFRMTVEVDTPQGLRTGSSVMEVYAYKSLGPKLPESHAAEVGFRGEAVVVDLPGDTLFVLPSNAKDGREFKELATRALDPSYRGGADLFVQSVTRLGKRSALGRQGIVDEQDYPLFVRFRDIKDPNTVEKVDPYSLSNSFGSAVKLKRVLVEVTDDRLTRHIGLRLPWLAAYCKRSFAGNRFTVTESLPDRLYCGSFSTEVRQ